MEIRVELATLEDLAGVMAIEEAVFEPGVADTEVAMRQRIEQTSDTFLVARNGSRQVLGYINGLLLSQRYVSDDLFKGIPQAHASGDQYLLVLGLAVSPQAQGQGLSSQLLAAFEQKARNVQARAVSLTCLEHLIPFYEKHGYLNEGVGESQHGNQVWYNMVKELPAL